MGYFLGVHEFIQQPILLSLLDVDELDTFLKNHTNTIEFLPKYKGVIYKVSQI